MTVARRPRPSKASFMPQKRLKPLLAGHPVSPMSPMPGFIHGLVRTGITPLPRAHRIITVGIPSFPQQDP